MKATEINHRNIRRWIQRASLLMRTKPGTIAASREGAEIVLIGQGEVLCWCAVVGHVDLFNLLGRRADDVLGSWWLGDTLGSWNLKEGQGSAIGCVSGSRAAACGGWALVNCGVDGATEQRDGLLGVADGVVLNFGWARLERELHRVTKDAHFLCGFCVKLKELVFGVVFQRCEKYVHRKPD